jgi:hypothetical protein
MGPLQFQQAMRARGFTLEPSGRWHGPFGITIPGTYNTIDTTSLADRARDETIKYVDQTIAVKRQFYDAK